MSKQRQLVRPRPRKKQPQVKNAPLTPVGKGELEVGFEELTDVRPLDVLLLFNLGDSEDL